MSVVAVVLQVPKVEQTINDHKTFSRRFGKGLALISEDGKPLAEMSIKLFVVVYFLSCFYGLTTFFFLSSALAFLKPRF